MYRLTPTGSGGVLIAQTSEGEKIYSQDSMHEFDWGYTVESITKTTQAELITGDYISYSLHQASGVFSEWQNLNVFIDSFSIGTSLLYTSPSTWSAIYSHNQTVQVYSYVLNTPLALTFGN